MAVSRERDVRQCPACGARDAEPCIALDGVPTADHDERPPARESVSGSTKHIALLVEIPAIYTDDIDGLREYQDGMSESEFLQDVIRVSGPVRVRCEVAGEKDSDVVEVWGDIREVRLVEPGWRGTLTDEQLAVHGGRLMRDEHACEWCLHRDSGPGALDA